MAGGAGGSRGRAVVAVWDRLSRQDLVFGFGTLGKLAVCGLNAVVCQRNVPVIILAREIVTESQRT